MIKQMVDLSAQKLGIYIFERMLALLLRMKPFNKLKPTNLNADRLYKNYNLTEIIDGVRQFEYDTDNDQLTIYCEDGRVFRITINQIN